MRTAGPDRPPYGPAHHRARPPGAFGPGVPIPPSRPRIHPSAALVRGVVAGRPNSSAPPQAQVYTKTNCAHRGAPVGFLPRQAALKLAPLSRTTAARSCHTPAHALARPLDPLASWALGPFGSLWPLGPWTLCPLKCGAGSSLNLKIYTNQIIQRRRITPRLSAAVVLSFPFASWLSHNGITASHGNAVGVRARMSRACIICAISSFPAEHDDVAAGLRGSSRPLGDKYNYGFLCRK